MWGAFLAGFTTLVKSWFDSKSKRIEARAQAEMAMAKVEADYDNLAIKQAQYSWKDEFIVLVWFAPLIVAWFEPDKANRWVEFVSELPYFYQIGMFGIIAASFGLRWFFKHQQFKVVKESK